MPGFTSWVFTTEKPVCTTDDGMHEFAGSSAMPAEIGGAYICRTCHILQVHRCGAITYMVPNNDDTTGAHICPACGKKFSSHRSVTDHLSHPCRHNMPGRWPRFHASYDDNRLDTFRAHDLASAAAHAIRTHNDGRHYDITLYDAGKYDLAFEPNKMHEDIITPLENNATRIHLDILAHRPKPKTYVERMT